MTVVDEFRSAQGPGKKQKGGPFDLINRIRERVRECACHTDGDPSDIQYLWVHVSKNGIGRRDGTAPREEHPSLQDWLNVVDEAASVGVKMVVATLDTSLAEHPDLEEICRWAQNTHEMIVGLHVQTSSISEEETAVLARLDACKTRLFVPGDAAENYQAIEKDQGIHVFLADPQPYGDPPNCNGPANMVFVSGSGVLYTCGLVEGNDEYRLGTIHEESFDKLLHDPDLPHSVAKTIHRVERGCDGCPSLLANYDGVS